MSPQESGETELLPHPTSLLMPSCEHTSLCTPMRACHTPLHCMGMLNAGLFPIPLAGLDAASVQGCACSFLHPGHPPHTHLGPHSGCSEQGGWGENVGTLGIWLLAQSQPHRPGGGWGWGALVLTLFSGHTGLLEVSPYNPGISLKLHLHLESLLAATIPVRVSR